MGLGSFVDINIFVMKHFYSVSSYSPFFSNLLNQNLQNVKTPTRKLESFFQRYYFKFRALAIVGIRYFKRTEVFSEITVHMDLFAGTFKKWSTLDIQIINLVSSILFIFLSKINMCLASLSRCLSNFKNILKISSAWFRNIISYFWVVSKCNILLSTWYPKAKFNHLDGFQTQKPTTFFEGYVTTGLFGLCSWLDNSGQYLYIHYSSVLSFIKFYLIIFYF